MKDFKLGQRYVSQSEPELGLGIVSDVQGRTVKFSFPLVGVNRLYRVDNAPVERFILQPGESAKNEKGLSFSIEKVREENGLIVYVGRAGREIKEQALTAKQMARPADLFKELKKIGANTHSKDAFKDISSKAFERRKKATELSFMWKSSAVRGMIGPKVSMIPHQYYLCYRGSTTVSMPRLMLSDEVGLGKTIEAGMIWHSLKARGRIERTLIIVPDTLKHQWMVEMMRRFNHLFTLVDDGYIRGLFVSVEKNETKPNPFMQSGDIIVSIETLMAQPALIEDLLKANWDMTIIDEAHHLVCEDGFTSHEYMLANAVLAKSKGALLLTGTPLQLHSESQFNRLKMLDPVRFSDYNTFIADQEAYRKLVNDLKKLPTDPNHHMSWEDLYDAVPKKSKIRPWLEAENSKAMKAGEWMRRIVDGMGTGSVVFRNTRKGVGGFPKRVLDEIPLEGNPEYRQMVQLVASRDLETSTDVQENGLLCTNYSDAWALDERFVWLKEFLKKYKDEKVLLICESINVVLALEVLLKDYLGEDAFAMFHEEMSIMARDKAAANFSKKSGANLLIASEIGSEGRNFQFSHHLILFDLPLDAALVEQRIGRLDRIGQTKDIIVHVPYVKGSGQEVMFKWYHEGLNAFRQPLMSGGELFLKYTDSLIEALADPENTLEDFAKKIIPQVKKDCEQIRNNIEKGRDRLLEYNSRDEEKAKEIIDEILRIDNESALKELLLESLHARGLDIDKSITEGCSVITMGPQIEEGSIAGMPSRGLVAAKSEDDEQGSENICLTVTFDRDIALVHDEVDFLSLEHPLAQGTIDFEMGSNNGVVACSMWQNSGLKGLMMQYNFALELPVPEDWGMSDITGAKYVSVLVDSSGNIQTEHLKHLNANDLRDVNVPQGNKAVDTTLNYFAKEGLALAKQSLMEYARNYAEKCAEQVEARSENEYQRMHHLCTIRGNVNGNAELQQLRKNVAERKKVAASPQLRLDAIRLLVCR